MWHRDVFRAMSAFYDGAYIRVKRQKMYLLLQKISVIYV